VSAFQSGLLESAPPIPGLDPSIVVHPRRLHLTLGVLPLASERKVSEGTTPPVGKTVAQAQALLEELRPRILEVLDGEKLRVPLNVVDIMTPNRGDPHQAHILWAGLPAEGSVAARLKVVCELIHTTFKREGFIVEQRPLKLHCTLLNTSHRKPRGRPFSYPALLNSSALRSLTDHVHPEADTDTAAQTATHGSPPLCSTAVPVDLGTWDVDEVQICAMGSHGPEGEYVSCGAITL
jgi:activating signal cointegrator complex subunit 1